MLRRAINLFLLLHLSNWRMSSSAFAVVYRLWRDPRRKAALLDWSALCAQPTGKPADPNDALSMASQGNQEMVSQAPFLVDLTTVRVLVFLGVWLSVYPVF